MDSLLMNRIAKQFANRRLSRRQALAATGAGFAAGALAPSASAQDATPSPDPEGGEKIDFLFVQSFGAGSIAPKGGGSETFTVSLTHGSGHTVFFADRPSREVGIVPTSEFVDGIGFGEADPPNAALILDTGNGETDIAVVELFNPIVTDDESGITYDVAVLADWQDEFDFGDQQASADLASLAPEFDAAYLFIDDCPSGQVQCYYDTDSGHLREKVGSPYSNDQIGGMCFTWNAFPPRCIPCVPGYHDENKTYDTTIDYWDSRCNTDHADECITAVGRRLCVAAWT